MTIEPKAIVHYEAEAYREDLDKLIREYVKKTPEAEGCEEMGKEILIFKNLDEAFESGILPRNQF